MYSNALLGANSSIDPNLVTEFCLLPLKVPQETVKTFYNISVYRMTYYKLIQPFKFLKPTKGRNNVMNLETCGHSNPTHVALQSLSTKIKNGLGIQRCIRLG